MKPILVLGIGNQLMMDDGVGIEVVRRLSREHTGVRYAVGETDFDYCLSLALEARFLVVVDAAQTGKEPGEVTVFPLHTITGSRPGLSLHQTHFLDMLTRTEPPVPGILIGIEPYQIDFHWGLSDRLQAQLESIVSRVQAAIGQVTTSYHQR